MSLSDEVCKKTKHELELRPEYIHKAMDIVNQKPLDVGTVENLREKLGIRSLCA
jgi:hypothetical protein